MAEVTFEVETVGVDYVCDKYWKGLMIQTGPMNLSDPMNPKYPHVCNNPACGDKMDFSEKYPTIRHLRKKD